MADINMTLAVQELWRLTMVDDDDCHKALKQVRQTSSLRGDERKEFKLFLEDLEDWLICYYDASSEPNSEQPE